MWLSKDHRQQQPVIHPPPRVRGRKVMRRNFALLHGEMHDLVWPGAIAGGVNMRRAGLHEFVRHDASAIGGDASLIKVQRRGVWHATESKQDFFSGDGHSLALVLERNGFLQTIATRVGQLRVRENLNAVAPEDLLHFHPGIGVELAQDVLTALDERDLDTKSREELRQLHRHRAAAEDDQGFWELRQCQGVVAGNIADLAKPRQRRWRDDRAGGDHEMRGGQRPGIVRKFLNQRVLTRHYFREVKTDIFRPDAPRPGMTGKVPDFCGVEQCLRGHTATQDAQPTNFVTAFDYDCPQAGTRCGPRRRITSAAAAENSDIVVKAVLRIVYGRHLIFHSQLQIFERSVTREILQHHER